MSRFVVDEFPTSCGECPCFSQIDGGCPFGDTIPACYWRFVAIYQYL